MSCEDEIICGFLHVVLALSEGEAEGSARPKCSFVTVHGTQENHIKWHFIKIEITCQYKKLPVVLVESQNSRVVWDWKGL